MKDLRGLVRLLQGCDTGFPVHTFGLKGFLACQKSLNKALNPKP